MSASIAPLAASLELLTQDCLASEESAVLWYMTMTDDEPMQRESTLIATIRTKLPDFAKMCADDAELSLRRRKGQKRCGYRKLHPH